jgi:hypothetical protein
MSKYRLALSRRQGRRRFDMRTISADQRRRSVVRRHHLAGDAAGPEAVTSALLALHATDPASVYLSVLARSAISTLADVSTAMYDRRTLVRWMAMRRTLFVFARSDVPVVQAAVSIPLAARLRRQMVARLERNGTDPRIDGDAGMWLGDLETRVEQALQGRGTATGAQLSTDEPALRTAIVPTAASDRPQNITSALLTLISAEGRIVRGTPTGSWTTRNHRWELAERWWPDGIPQLPLGDSQRELARRWLTRFGPATVADLQWWTGWNQTTVRHALTGLPIDEIDLHGETGIALPGFDDDDAATTPGVTLLPALDPTPMGWKHRDWLFSIDPRQVFDRNGNIGPTLWWDGKVIGSWAVAPSGEVRTAVAADRGTDALVSVQGAAALLQHRFNGAVVTPAIRTPLERSLLGDP